MPTALPFRDVLEQYVRRAGYTTGQLSRLSGVPKMTILNWLEGRVKKPRVRKDLLKLAAVLHLSEAEASALLQAAGQPTVEELLLSEAPSDHDMLMPWAETVRQRIVSAPFQAIADLPYFVGREHELSALSAALLADNHLTVYSLQGMGGVGKTMLAAHIAYRLRPHFPDGVLWARVDTADPLSILRAFAQAYGSDISAYKDLESRSQVVRDILAHKRALVVLDSVQRSHDIQHLLPPTGSCAVLITTRRQDLVVTRGAHIFRLGPFNSGGREALDLFTVLLGEERARREAASLVEIAGLLGHLPLALAIIAGRMVAEPGWSAIAVLDRLHQETRRLNELAAEDQSVRLSFQLSYDALLPDQRQLFAALGVFGGDDFGVEAAAAVGAISIDAAADTMRSLYTLSLVQKGQLGRYRLHPLLRDYAREHLGDSAAFERMVTFFVCYAESHAQDYDSLDAENNNILAALEAAWHRTMYEALIRGANAFYHFLEVRGLYGSAKIHLQHAHEAASIVGDAVGLMQASLKLGRLAERQGEYAQAEILLREGLALAHHSEQAEEVIAALTYLGAVVSHQGSYVQAEECWQEGLALARQIGHQERISVLLTHLGVGARRRGDLAQAERYWQEGLALARAIDQLEHTSLLLTNLGALAGQRGDYAQAATYLQEGLGLARQIGHRERIGILLVNLGALAHRHGDDARAEAYFQEGLTLAYEIGNQWLISSILNEWGEYHLNRRHLDTASTSFRTMLDIACTAGLREHTATAWYGLARVAAAEGQAAEAYSQGQKSLALFEAISHPQASIVAQWIAKLLE